MLDFEYGVKRLGILQNYKDKFKLEANFSQETIEIFFALWNVSNARMDLIMTWVALQILESQT